MFNKMRASTARTTGLAVGLALTATGAAAEQTIVILQSLTGPAAFIGAGAAEGMEMALGEANEAGEFGEGVTYRVLVEDDATDRTQALSLVTRHAANADVLLILGPTSGPVAHAGAQLGNELEIPVITMTNALSIADMGPWGFISTQPPRQMMSYLVEFAAEERQVERCSTIAIRDNEAYVLLRTAFEEMIADHGVTIVSSEAIAATDIDFSALATKLAMEDIDCLGIITPAALGGNLVRQLREAGLSPDVEIFGNNTFSSPEFIQTGGGAVEGVYMLSDWLPGGFNDFSTAFVQNFEARTGHAPDNWNALGYTMGRVVVTALKTAGPDATRDEVRAALTATSEVPSVIGSGLYSYIDDRHPVSGSNIMQVRDGATVLVSD